MGTYSSAVQARASQQVRVLWVGDSHLEGWGATTRSARLQQRVQARWRTRYGGAGNDGHVKVGYYVPGSWASQGTWAGTFTGVDDFGLARRTFYMAAGATWTLPATVCTSVRVEMLFNPDGGYGDVEVLADGVLVSTIDSSVFGAVLPGVHFPVALGASASRTITLRAKTAQVLLGGVTIFNGDETTGVWMIDSAKSGTASTGTGWTSAGGSTWSAWQFSEPDLVIDDLWHNDYIGGGCTPTQSADNFAARVANYRSFAKVPDVVLYQHWIPSTFTTSANGAGYTYAQYESALAAKAASLSPPVPVFNLQSLYGTPAARLIDDGTHSNDSGQDTAAGVLETWLHTTLVGPAGTVAATTTTAGAVKLRRPAAGVVPATTTTCAAPKLRRPVSGAVAATTTVTGTTVARRPTTGTIAYRNTWY